jgi:hypothetical protein
MNINLLIALIPLLLLAVWIYALRSAEKSATARLGENVEMIALHRRWSRVLQYVGFCLALTLPLIMVVVAILDEVSWDEILPMLGQSLWFGSIGYGFRHGPRLILGTRGFAYGAAGFTPWEEVEEVKWDRDIGQRAWGVMIRSSDEEGVHKLRIYIRRDLKERVDVLFEKFRATELLQADPNMTHAAKAHRSV